MRFLLVAAAAVPFVISTYLFVAVVVGVPRGRRRCRRCRHHDRTFVVAVDVVMLVTIGVVIVVDFVVAVVVVV